MSTKKTGEQLKNDNRIRQCTDEFRCDNKQCRALIGYVDRPLDRNVIIKVVCPACRKRWEEEQKG